MADGHRPRSWRGWCVLFGACAAAGLGFALSSAEETPEPPARNTVVLLKNGRLLTGRVQESPTGFVVEAHNGSMLIPFENARFAARDRQDACRRLHEDVLKEPSAAGHTALARWCVTNELYDEARAELRDALALEPESREARTMLVRLDEVLNPGKTEPSEVVEPAPPSGDTFTPAPATSLAGLSRESAETFVLRVQPILINKCGNASCHGPASKSEFRLTHVRPGAGSHRIHAERNLAAVLGQIETARPDRSPLLVVGRGNHGRGGRPVFQGPGAGQQLATLEGWVRAAAREMSPDAGRAAWPEPIAPAPRGGAESQVLIRGRKEPEAKPAGPPAEETGADVLEAVLEEERKDAFDPREFNRLVHGIE